MHFSMKILAAGLLWLTAIASAIPVQAAFRLPALIGNNMVLQQNATIRVWGWADAGEKIVIQPGWQTGSVMAVTTTEGNWETTLHTPAAGGPYKMTLTGRDFTVQIENILIGEVWVCSGQSNMEFSMRGLGGWKNYKPIEKEKVISDKYDKVRLFGVKRDTSAVALNQCSGHWQTADTNTVNDFSATAWFYGAYLNEQLGVPVGLILAAWGGTPAEVWMPVEAIKAIPDLGYFLNYHNGSQWWPGTAGVLYNAMIHPLLKYTIRGAIWYQGESNVTDAQLYPALMQTLITAWRKAWGLGDFPFYYVQIAPYNYQKPYEGALLREAQLKCLSVPNTGMAVTMDLVDNVNDIHPKNKLDVGKRLALWALNKTYGKADVHFSGPLYSAMKISGKSIILNFSYADGGLKILKNQKNNFKIAGADRVFYPATVQISGSTLVVSSPKVKQPQAVRYAFENAAEATLFNGNGLPASSFRTDDWDIITANISLKPFVDKTTGTMAYQLASPARETDIYYDFNKLPGKNSARFTTPFQPGTTGTLYAVLTRNGYFTENIQQWKLVANKALAAKVTYKSPYSEAYTAGASLGLVDGICGSLNAFDDSWQGFEGSDLDVVIDLGKTIAIKAVMCNFLSNNNDWIFLPKRVIAEVSEDGINYRQIGESRFSDDSEIKGGLIQSVNYKYQGSGRYVKLTAQNVGICPKWHPGTGNKAWLFADEIVVK